ncbi:MAG: ATP-binding cassette domain-containing protein, partial [Nitrospinales bacterium]
MRIRRRLGKSLALWFYDKLGIMTVSELEVKNLRVAFSTPDGELTAVNGISYNLWRGETLAIVGESGCGKTAGVLAVLRLIPEPPGKVSGGEIRFDGRNILALSPKELRAVRGNEIAMIFQDPMTSLNPVFTIGSQIVETLLKHTAMSYSQAREKAIDLLRQVEIPLPEQKVDAYPHQLSGGMR